MLLLILLGLLTIVVCIHAAMFWTGKARDLNKLPGPPKFPIIGNSYQFLGGMIQVFYKTRSYANNYKTNYGFFMGGDRIYNLLEPDDIEILLSSQKHIVKSQLYDMILPWLGEGLLISRGEKWQKRRKILTHAFHFNILKKFCMTFVEHSKNFAEKLRNNVNKETEVQPHIAKAALHVICDTAMGTNLDTLGDKATSYIQSIYKFGENFMYRVTRVWLHRRQFYNLTKKGQELNETVDKLHTFTKTVIAERRKEKQAVGFDNDDCEDDNDDMITKKKKLAMLDLLLVAESKGEIDENGIREEVDTFMFEGHDTVTVAMTFCLMMLANYPEIQENAHKEVSEILGSSDNTPTINDLNNMNYLERCIKESLRLYPSVPFVARKIFEDLQLTKFKVPAGSHCNVHIFDMHRNEKYFPNPDKYDPDRFLPENCVNRHPFVYIPFSAGPRNCIGQKFAILEMKSLASAILMKYKLEAVTRPDDLIFRSDIVLRTVNPVKVKFILR